VTGIVLGFALMLMPQAAIAQSIAIAALPTFSAQVAQNRMSEMRHSLASSLRAALLLSIPASLGLMILRKPIIQVLYQRGQFDERSTELVAWALLWFSAGLVGHALVEILSRAFYSLHDTKTPVYIGVAAMSLNILFSYLFSALFLRIGWLPHGGLALANSAATGLEAVGLVFLMRRRLAGLEGLYILEGIWKSLTATLAMGIALFVWLSAIHGAPAWIVAAGGIAFGGASFTLIAFALGVGELRSAAGYLKRRLAG